jgi:hypothetical protein
LAFSCVIAEIKTNVSKTDSVSIIRGNMRNDITSLIYRLYQSFPMNPLRGLAGLTAIYTSDWSFLMLFLMMETEPASETKVSISAFCHGRSTERL